jgi:hypothetical protein
MHQYDAPLLRLTFAHPSQNFVAAAGWLHEAIVASSF